MQSSDDIPKEYERRFAASSAYRMEVWRRLVRGFFRRYAPRDGAVLDLGAGWGEFIRNIEARRRLAIDLNPEAPARIGEGVAVIVQDCSRQWAVQSEVLDLVFTSNLFEHLADKDSVRRALLEANRCLKRGGRIVCLGPNIRFLPGRYWDFWDHLIPLTDASMSEVLSLTGFQVERSVPRFLPYSMSQGFRPPPLLVSAYVRCPLLWRFVGRQFLVVGRKP